MRLGHDQNQHRAIIVLMARIHRGGNLCLNQSSFFFESYREKNRKPPERPELTGACVGAAKDSWSSAAPLRLQART